MDSLLNFIFKLAQSALTLQLLGGLLVILLVMIATIHWEKIKPFFDLKYAARALFILLSPLALMAFIEIFEIVQAGSDKFGDDKRGYTILLAALAGAPFVIWRTWIAQKQGIVAEQGHMTDRISKAVEQLGAEKTTHDGENQKTEPNLEVRVGAIYALERIAQDSMRDHISVMEILCAYVRNNAPGSGPEGVMYTSDALRAKIDELISPRIAPIDIQAAMSVIGRRKVEHIKFERDAARNTIKRRYELDLRKTHLEKVDLKKANLDCAQLTEANLVMADLSGAQLREASLDDAQLLEADLVGAKLQGANLSGTQLGGADITSASFVFALVITTQLDVVIGLTEDQVRSMYGDESTTLPLNMPKPEWAENKFDGDHFYAKWRAAKKEAGLP